jgi:hypothetical protein
MIERVDVCFQELAGLGVDIERKIADFSALEVGSRELAASETESRDLKWLAVEVQPGHSVNSKPTMERQILRS